jgi:putative transposase
VRHFAQNGEYTRGPRSYYKAELIRGLAREGRPWRTLEDVELATLSRVHWHNHDRLQTYLGDEPPAKFEQTLYATKRTDQLLVETQIA